MIVSGLLLAFSVLLIGVYIVLNSEYNRGIGPRFRYTKTLTGFLNKLQLNTLNNLDLIVMKQLKLSNPPSHKQRQTGLMMMAFSFILFLLTVITRSSSLLLIVSILGMLLGFINPYIMARTTQKEFEEAIEKEVPEMLEVFNFYITSGRTLEDALDLTSENIGPNLTPYIKKMVTNMLVQSKEEAITLLSEELSFNQNMTIFCSALKQAIKGYSDTLHNFVAMQSKLHVQLKNEQIERIIMQMPTKFSMVSAVLIITMIMFLVVPVFTNVFTGMDVFIGGM